MYGDRLYHSFCTSGTLPNPEVKVMLRIPSNHGHRKHARHGPCYTNVREPEVDKITAKVVIRIA